MTTTFIKRECFSNNHMKKIFQNVVSMFKDDIEEKERVINDYDYILDVIDGKYNILETDGNFLEIGSFFGVGTKKVADYLKYSDKKLISVDCFDIEYDDTIRNDGKSMRKIYSSFCEGDECKKQYDVYKENIAGYSNVVTIKKNTRFVDKEMMMVDDIKNAFILIDGSKTSKIFRLDLMKAWEILSFDGVMCIPDYYTKRDKKYVFQHINNYVDALIQNNKTAIGRVVMSKDNMIFVQKIQKKGGRPKLKEI